MTPPPERARNTLAHRAASLALAVAFAGSCDPGARRDEHAAEVRIVRQEGRWTSVVGPDLMSDADDGLYLISGELRNDGARSILSVKLSFELYDESDRLVASEYGYNRRAEALREPAYEAGELARDELGIEPLPPGATDLFRMMFLRREVPRFHTWRVRVLELEYE